MTGRNLHKSCKEAQCHKTASQSNTFFGKSKPFSSLFMIEQQSVDYLTTAHTMFLSKRFYN